MAFMGMALIFLLIVLIIMGFMFVLMIFFFIFGLIQKKRGKKSGTVFLAASGVICAGFAAVILFFVLPVRVDISTPNGEDYVWSNSRSKFFTAVYNGDYQTVDKLLEKTPKLIYATDTANDMDGLDIAVSQNDIATAERIAAHGGRFDDGIGLAASRYDYSFQYYFDNYYRRHGTEAADVSDLECVRFMIDNGAAVDFGKDGEISPVLFWAIDAVTFDGEITNDELKEIELLIDNGADINDKNLSGDTLLEHFMQRSGIDNISENENAEKLKSMITANQEIAD